MIASMIKRSPLVLALIMAVGELRRHRTPVNRACDRLLRDHGGQTVLVVSHVTLIKILLCRALGVSLDTLYRLYLGSACINEIQWHGRGFATVHRVNDTSHLS